MFRRSMDYFAFGGKPFLLGASPKLEAKPRSRFPPHIPGIFTQEQAEAQLLSSTS